MRHNIRAPGQVGPERTFGWPLAEGRAFLGASPQPDRPSVATFFSPLATPRGTVLLRLEGTLQGLPEVATKGCGFLPGQVGLGPWRN